MKSFSTILFFFLSLFCISQNRDLTYSTGSGFSVLNEFINSSTLQNDGKLLIAGKFSMFNGVSTNNFIRLNTNGTIDTAFKTNLGTGFNLETGDVVVQPDGKILVLIHNSSTNPEFNGTAIKKIVRLNSNGTLDNSFNYYRANLNFTPERLILQSDGKIIVSSYDNIVRVNSNGTLDNSFSISNVSGGLTPTTRSLAIDSNNKIIVVGSFFTVNSQNIRGIVRLNSDGTIDNSFNVGSGFNGSVNSVAIQSDNKIIAGGQISTLNGINISKVVRLNSDGSIDSSFNFTETIFSGNLKTVNLQSNGSIIVTGNSNATSSNISIVRLFSNGQNDNSLNISSNFFGYSCSSVQIQSDGKFIFLGDFYEFNSVTVNRIIRITNPVLSTNQFEQNKIKVYPNPVKEIIYLSNIEKVEYEIVDITGKSILRGISNENNINVSNLEKGIYILKMKEKGNIINKRIIKE